MSALRIRLATLSAALAVASASAAAAQQSSSTPPAPAATPAAEPAKEQAPQARREGRPRRRASRDRLDAEEIRQNQSTLYDAYSLVSSLRPGWLTVRRASMMLPEAVRVYRDGVAMGGVGALRQISTRSIDRIEHLDDNQATMRFGTGHGSGAILVFTRS